MKFGIQEIKKLWENEKAVAESPIMMLVFLAIGLLVLALVLTVGPVIGYNVDSSVTIPSGTAASASFTLTGNVSDNESVNMTVNSALFQFRFAYNMSGDVDYGTYPAVQASANPVNLKPFANTSAAAATNLTAAINANATLAALVTATNPSDGVVTVTLDSTGVAGNSNSAAETAANGVWGSFASGVDASPWSPINNAAITNGTELWSQNTPMISVTALVVIVGVLIFVLIGVMGGRGGKGGIGL